MSSQTIAQLVVSLEANIARYSTEMQRASSIATTTMGGISKAAGVAAAGLATLGVGLSAGALIGWSKEVIAGASALDDLADSTGSTVENLSRLTNQARISGTSVDAMSTLLNKLAAGMAGADDEASNVGRALKFLGVEARDPAQALQEIAVKLDQYADGIGKAALAKDLFGKMGVQYIATLKDIAKLQDVAATTTTRQAVEAEKLEQALRRLSVEATAFKDVVLSHVVPALNNFIERARIARQAGNGIFDSLVLAGTNTGNIVDQITRAGAKVAELNDLVEKGRAKNQNSPYFNPMLLKDYEEKLEAAKRKLETLIQIRDKWLANNVEGMGYTGDARDQRAGSGAASVGKEIPSYTGVKEEAAKAAKSVNEYAKSLAALYKILDNTGSSVNDEFLTNLEMLRGEWAAGEMSLEKYQARVGELIKQTKFGSQALAAMEEAARENNRAFDEAFAIVERAREATENSIRSARELTEGLEFEAQALTMTNAEREIAIRLRDLERSGLDKSSEAYALFAERIRNAVIKKEELQGQIDLWNEVERSAHDYFVNILADGQNAFERLKNALKTGLYELLYQMTAKKWILQIGAKVSDNPAIAGTAGGFLGGGDLLGGLGNILSSAGGAGMLGGSFATTALGESLGLSVAMGAGEGMALTALGSAIAPLMAALPWVALAAVAVPLIVDLFDDGDAERTADFINSGSGRAWSGDKQRTSAFGNFGLDNGRWFSDDMDQALNAMLDTIQSLDDAIAQSVGPEMTAAITQALEGSRGYGFGMEHTDLNASGVVGGILKDRYSVVLDALDARLGDVLRGFSGTGEQLGQFVVTLVALDKVTRKLPESIRDGLIAALDSTAASVERVGAFGNAFATLQDAMNADPLDDALEAIAAQTSGAYGAFDRAGLALQALMDGFDGTTAAANQLTGATGAYYSAQVQLLAQLEMVKQALTGPEGLFAGTIRNIRMSVLDDAGRLDFLRAETEGLRGRLLDAKDPGEIQRLAELINANINQAFALLTPEEQLANAQGYIDQLDAFNAQVAARLTELQESTQQQAADQLTALRTMLAAEIAKMADAAAVQQTAADTNLTAARTPLVVNVVNRGTEVNA